MAIKCSSSETVVFSWIIWPSREIRDAAMSKVMEDPCHQPESNLMPFGGNRMIDGGFQVTVDQ